MIEILPSFLSEADALARIIALAHDPQRKLTDPPDADVVRLIGEALQCAYDAGRSPKAVSQETRDQWVCRSCGGPFEYPAGLTPNFCPYCRSTDLEKVAS